MNVVGCVACAFLVISILDVARARDFNAIFDNLPSDIGHAISSAWKGVLKAIKAPMRPRKFRRGKKKKVTTTTVTEFSVPMTTTLTTTISTIAPKRPTIPFITRPDWTSFLDWRILQNPDLVKLARQYHRGPPYYGRKIESYEDTTLKLSTSEEEVFEYNTILNKVTKGQRKKIAIPVIPTPEYKYDYLRRFKFRNDAYTINSHSKDASSPETLKSSTKLETTTEDVSSLLKQFRFGRYRLKIFYKISLQ